MSSVERQFVMIVGIYIKIMLRVKFMPDRANINKKRSKTFSSRYLNRSENVWNLLKANEEERIDFSLIQGFITFLIFDMR